MVTRNELSETLDSLVTPATFTLFAKISNLTNRDNYVALMTLIHNREINLPTLASIPILDDIAVAELLRKREILFNAAIVSNTPNPAYSFLLDSVLPTKMYTYLQGYNTYMNGLLETGTENVREIFRPISAEFGLELGSPYNNYQEFQLAFENNVLSKLLAKYSVANVSSVFPSYTPNASLTTTEKTFLNGIYTKLFGAAKAAFNNANLHRFAVWTDDIPSVFMDNLALFNDLLNVTPYTKIVEPFVQNEIFSMAARSSLLYTAGDVSTLKNEVYAFDVLSIPLGEALNYIELKWLVINTIEQKSSMAVSELFLTEFRRLYTCIQTFKQLYVTLVETILQNLHVKVK